MQSTKKISFGSTFFPCQPLLHMDFNLMFLDENLWFSEWPHVGDSQWPGIGEPLAVDEADSLVPLPESLSQFDFDMIMENPQAQIPYQRQCRAAHLEQLDVKDELYLGDIDLESFAWASHSPGQTQDADAVLLSSCDFKFEDDAKETKSGDGRAPRLNDLGFDEIKSYFYMPITKAAKEMNVGLTLLKKRCRELGIARWPHRKMKSLKSLIRNVQELGNGMSEESVRRELEGLEQHRRIMEENPEIQLTERTKRLRQACFKANYKKRRLNQQPCPSNGTFY